ncbi:MAG: hypothetical protein AAB229_07335 [Candidatus Hydrogenedentota bacterium]
MTTCPSEARSATERECIAFGIRLAAAFREREKTLRDVLDAEKTVRRESGRNFCRLPATLGPELTNPEDKATLLQFLSESLVKDIEESGLIERGRPKSSRGFLFNAWLGDNEEFWLTALGGSAEAIAIGVSTMLAAVDLQDTEENALIGPFQRFVTSTRLGFSVLRVWIRESNVDVVHDRIGAAFYNGKIQQPVSRQRNGILLRELRERLKANRLKSRRRSVGLINLLIGLTVRSGSIAEYRRSEADLWRGDGRGVDLFSPERNMMRVLYGATAVSFRPEDQKADDPVRAIRRKLVSKELTPESALSELLFAKIGAKDTLELASLIAMLDGSNQCCSILDGFRQIVVDSSRSGKKLNAFLVKNVIQGIMNALEKILEPQPNLAPNEYFLIPQSPGAWLLVPGAVPALLSSSALFRIVESRDVGTAPFHLLRGSDNGQPFLDGCMPPYFRKLGFILPDGIDRIAG